MKRLLAIVALLAVPAYATRPTPGYTSRPCGFDLDNDGVFGEASDDCNICDGTTTDPDGDSDLEDLNYIDGDSGEDDVNCGAPGDPCATVAYVLNGSNSSYSKYADGVSGGDPEDILCVKGTVVMTTEADSLSISGEANTHTAAYYDTDVAQWGSGGDSYFEYPSDPFMIVGWDADNDGSYPPHDTDDTAVLTCDQGGGTYTDQMFLISGDYIEIAHLKIEKCGYNNDSGGNAGFTRWGTSDGHLWIHDLHIYQVLYDATHESYHIVFDSFGWSDNQWMAYENLYLEEVGAYTFRGSAYPETSDVKIEYFTVKYHCNTGHETNYMNGCTFYRTWAYMNRVSVSYNDLDYDMDTWWSTLWDSNSIAVAPSTCNRNFWIRGNNFKDFFDAIQFRPNTGEGCGGSQRHQTGMLVENNFFWLDWIHTNQSVGFFISVSDQGSDHADYYLDDLKVYNNIIIETTGENIRWGIYLDGGGNDTTNFSGTYEFVGNTIWGDFSGAGDIVEFADNYTYNADVVWKNNIIAGTTGASGENIRFDFADSNFTGGNNVYDDTEDYVWQGVSKTTVGDWNTSSGDSGTECDPTFINPSNGNAHLDSSDTCAQDTGANVSGYITTDFDDDARPQGSGWDIGADEVLGDAPSSGTAGAASEGTTMAGAEAGG